MDLTGYYYFFYWLTFSTTSTTSKVPIGGYTPQGKEAVADSNDTTSRSSGSGGGGDPVENFVFRGHPEKYTSATSIEAPPLTKSAVGTPLFLLTLLLPILIPLLVYYEQLEHLLSVLHVISSRALGILLLPLLI